MTEYAMDGRNKEQDQSRYGVHWGKRDGKPQYVEFFFFWGGGGGGGVGGVGGGGGRGEE